MITGTDAALELEQGISKPRQCQVPRSQDKSDLGETIKVQIHQCLAKQMPAM